ncbi:hypothetical protein BDZ89DRAFT_1056632 [Hymenopellis radicata]|nr:hypothetical protein BDZ89DRAFT_1056632 [Hymenopellis radicata]
MYQPAYGAVFDPTLTLSATCCCQRRLQFHSFTLFVCMLRHTRVSMDVSASYCGTDLVYLPTLGEYPRLRGKSQFPQLLRVTRQVSGN